MYMGVILGRFSIASQPLRAPHVYGGDPDTGMQAIGKDGVLPMYMGVIPVLVHHDLHC